MYTNPNKNIVLGVDDLQELECFESSTGYALAKMHEALGLGMRWEFTPAQYEKLKKTAERLRRKPVPKSKNEVDLIDRSLLEKPFRAKCSKSSFCSMVRYATKLGKTGGGLEIVLTFAKKDMAPGSALILRQRGHKPVLYLNYCPFCGVQLVQKTTKKAKR